MQIFLMIYVMLCKMYNYLLKYMIMDYISILFFMLILSMLGFVLLYLSWYLGSSTLGSSRFSIYECGFSSLSGNNKPFTAQYYIIALIFLLFDVELLYMFPWMLTVKFNLLQKSFFILWIFSFLLIISYLYEILKGSLKWYDGFNQRSLKKRLNSLRYLNKFNSKLILSNCNIYWVLMMLAKNYHMNPLFYFLCVLLSIVFSYTVMREVLINYKSPIQKSSPSIYGRIYYYLTITLMVLFIMWLFVH